MRGALTLLIAVSLLACEAYAQTNVLRQQGLEDAESDQVVVELFRENRELKSQLLELENQAESLRRQLAEARSALDLLREESSAASAAVEAPTAGMSYRDVTQMRVMDVNRKMGVAVVSGGVRAGMKVGMRFSVLHDEAVIGEIRLVEVREYFAGGLIEKVEKDTFPVEGDRLILSTIQD